MLGVEGVGVEGLGFRDQRKRSVENVEPPAMLGVGFRLHLTQCIHSVVLESQLLNKTVNLLFQLTN